MLGYFALTAAALATAGYQSMAPTGQWYGRTFIGLGRGSKKLALTFDDGPNDPHTLGLLEVLAKHDVDRKSTRLNSSHRCISYAVFCLKKKKVTTNILLSIE